MKINKILVLKAILLATVIIICNSCICYAGSTGLPSLDGLQPQVELGSAENIIETILGVFTVLGAITMAISIALIGFYMILGSANEKAAGQEKCIGLFAAAAIITGGCSIAKMIISFAEKI